MIFVSFEFIKILFIVLANIVIIGLAISFLLGFVLVPIPLVHDLIHNLYYVHDIYDYFLQARECCRDVMEGCFIYCFLEIL